MSDDLVKRLRDDQPVTQDMVSTMQCALQDAAADRIEELEAKLAKVVDASKWQHIETAPYETLILTFWPGNSKRRQVILLNTRNDGTYLGKKDGFWYSKPDQYPTHWMPLPNPPLAELTGGKNE